MGSGQVDNLVKRARGGKGGRPHHMHSPPFSSGFEKILFTVTDVDYPGPRPNECRVT